MKPTGSYVLNPSAPRKGSNRFRTWTKLESAEDVEESSAISPTFGSCFVGWSSSLARWRAELLCKSLSFFPPCGRERTLPEMKLFSPPQYLPLDCFPVGRAAFPRYSQTFGRSRDDAALVLWSVCTELQAWMPWRMASLLRTNSLRLENYKNDVQKKAGCPL